MSRSWCAKSVIFMRFFSFESIFCQILPGSVQHSWSCGLGVQVLLYSTDRNLQSPILKHGMHFLPMENPLQGYAQKHFMYIAFLFYFYLYLLIL